MSPGAAPVSMASWIVPTENTSTFWSVVWVLYHFVSSSPRFTVSRTSTRSPALTPPAVAINWGSGSQKATLPGGRFDATSRARLARLSWARTRMVSLNSFDAAYLPAASSTVATAPAGAKSAGNGRIASMSGEMIVFSAISRATVTTYTCLIC